jgi:predicted DNA-binding transcriptional regulator YafY
MRAERLVALLFTLQGRRAATTTELAAELGVSVRTMHRDIAALRELGVPVWTEQGRNGGVRLVEGWRARLGGLTSREAVAIFAMGVPEALAGLGLETAMSAAHAKVSAALPEPLREQARDIGQRFLLDAPGWFRQAEGSEQLAALARAIWEQRRTRIGYRDGERVVNPLGLVLKAGVWYLVADTGTSVLTYRVSRVSRVSAVDELDERFTRPADFDLAAWWRQTSTRFERSLRNAIVRVRLSPRGVRALPVAVGADVAVDALELAGPPDPDGWTEAELGLENPDIAAHQLLGLGTDVEIISPAEVRAAFADITGRMAERHR